MWMVLVLFTFLSVHDHRGEAIEQCSVTYHFSIACNGTSTISDNLTDPVMLQHRNNEDWNHWINANITVVEGETLAEAEIELHDNVTDFQLRWIQDGATENPAWLIDEIHITCLNSEFSATKTFEETDRTFHNFWECSSGYLATGNSDCIQGATEFHLLMNGTEREARTRVFNINSGAPADISNDSVSSCRECPSETVSSLHWMVSYVGTQVNLPCSNNTAVNIRRTCSFNGTTAVWEPSLVDVFNSCRIGTPPAGAVCAEEITNSLTWPATTLGMSLSEFCLQTEMSIRRQCVYDGVSTYWHPNSSTVQQMCPNGTQRVSERVGMLAIQINEVPVDEGIRLIQNLTSARDYRYPNDLVLIKNLTTSILDRLEGKASREFSQNFGSTMSELLEGDAVNAVRNGSETSQADYVVSVLELTDRFALEYHNASSGEVASNNLRVTAVDVDSSMESVEVFSNETFGSITLNSSVFMNMNTTGRAGGVFYANLTDILPRDNRSNYTLESAVFSVVVNTEVSFQNQSAVRYNLTHRKPNKDEAPACLFYDLTDDSNPFWSSDGCQVVETTDTHTMCSCDHLTHFAVLFDARGTNSELGDDHSTALQVITYVGVGISLPLLLLTIICFLVLRALWSLRTFVNINLCATLFVAQLIFVVGADQTSSDAGCATVAILLHFFFLTTFMWMLMEGVILYIMLVRVFAQIDWKYYTAFILTSYGGPLLYMVVCIPLGLARADEWSYGSDDVCWLTYDDNFIWAFIAPVILIIVINIGFLIMAMRIMYKHRDTAKSKKGSLWYWFKGCFTLIISMGITWVFGLLALHEFLLPLIYLFAIFTSLQGIWIFLLFIALSRPVHEAGKQWWLSTVSKSEILSTYHFKKTQSSFMKSSRHENSTFASKKETSQISIDIKTDFTSKDEMVKIEALDSSPKTNGRISVSPTDSSSFKESSA